MSGPIVLPDAQPADPGPLPGFLLARSERDSGIAHDAVPWPLHPKPEQLRRQRACCLANATRIDVAIGKLRAVLVTKCRLDEALIVFASDLGAHARRDRRRALNACVQRGSTGIPWCASGAPGVRMLVAVGP